MELLATKIQKSILQADIFWVLGIPKYRERDLSGLRKQCYARCLDLNLSGRNLRIDPICPPPRDRSLDANDRLELDSLDELEGLTVPVNDHLRDSVVISKVHE
jgi:hypothetical protein